MLIVQPMRIPVTNMGVITPAIVTGDVTTWFNRSGVTTEISSSRSLDAVLVSSSYSTDSVLFVVVSLTLVSFCVC